MAKAKIPNTTVPATAIIATDLNLFKSTKKRALAPKTDIRMLLMAATYSIWTLVVEPPNKSTTLGPIYIKMPAEIAEDATVADSTRR